MHTVLLKHSPGTQWLTEVAEDDAGVQDAEKRNLHWGAPSLSLKYPSATKLMLSKVNGKDPAHAIELRRNVPIDFR